jgi:hypothetical protein
MRHRSVWLVAAVAAVAAVAMVGGSIGPERAAAGPTTLRACTASELPAPELGAVTINQGLGSYANEKLVRGKETLVRFFLKLPGVVGTQCSGSINVINTSSSQTRITLIDPSTTDDAFTGDLPNPIAPYQTYPSAGTAISSSSVSVNSSADPIFVVPASRVTACDTTPCSIVTSFSLQFRARIYYTTSASSTPTFREFSFMPPPAAPSTPIQGNFSELPNAFRVLVIPMGDKNQLYSSQFTSTGDQAVRSGFDALSRMLPVPAGVSSTLRTTSGGIRYWIDLAAMLDLKAIPGAYPSGSTRFCGTQQNFDGTAANNYQDGIKAKLAWYLQTYNSNPANAAYPADRVLGVVDSAISDGSTSPLNCAEGFASTISPEAWVRAIPDQPASGRTAAVPSMTGSLMAMELLHTLGQENVAAAGLVHSSATVADGTAPDRGYHITSRSFIANDRTALNFVNTSTAPWNNNSTLLELGAFERALCNFGGVVPPVNSSFQCTTPSEIGTPAAAAGTGHFVISATTDGTAANTAVTSSQLLQPQQEALDDHEVLETPCLASSQYNLAFYTFADQPGSPSTVCYVPISGPVSEHDATTHVINTTLTIAGAFPSPGGVTKVELRKGNTVLHTENVQEGGLEIVGASLNPGSSFTQTKTITTTPIPPKIDICLDEDESGSFSDDIETLRALVDPETGTLIPALDDTGANYATCVVGFRDFAQGLWGDAGDWVYKRHADVTAGGGGVETGVPLLTAGGGGDLPEAQLENLHYLATPSHPAINSNGNFTPDFGAPILDDPEDTPAGLQPTWRSQAKRVVLLATDAECHVTGDDGGWPGDEGTTSAATTAGILADAEITVIGLIPNVDSPIACVSDLASGTGGSVHSIGTDSSTLVDAIMAGLGNLDVTVEPSVDCSPDLTVSLNPEGAQTVESGEDVSWEETFTLAAGATETQTCTIDFLVDEVAIDTQTVTIPVDNTSSSEVKIIAPSDTKADTFIECNGGQLPGQVALPRSGVAGSASTFVINADTTNACAGPDGSDPQVSVLFTDGSSHELVSLDGAGATDEHGQPKTPEDPTASIYAPAPNYVNPENKPFALNGQVFDPEDGPLTPSWTITGPAGSGILLTASGNFADVSPPSGTWPLGNYTVAISGTDSDGNATPPTSVIVHVRRYVFSGFLPPISPLPVVNDGRAKSTIPIKWQLRDQAGNFITDLGVVAAIRVASTPCLGAVTVCDVTPTGGTMLRYDTKTNQYVYNWLTPSTPGTYVVSVHFTDGNTYVAYFNLTK